MNVVKHIICELTGYRPGTVDVSQGDRGSRAVSCRLMENGAPWMIPDGATARVAYTLPDGTEGLYDRRPDGSPMWEISKNIVTVELADQLMAQAGMVQMSILILGPEGGQLATWPIRVMVSADKAARLTVPEAMPPYGAGFAGKIFFGGEDGTVTPLDIGDGVEIVLQEDGTFALVAYGGGGGGGGITEEKDPTVYAWAKQPQKPTYTAQEVGAMPAGTKIPGKTSELTNDAGFVNKAVNDLANYYTKVQTQALIAAIPRFRVTVVQQLPAAGEELVLYLVPFATAEGQYLEYIWVDGRWEIIGSQRVDLTGYATEVWVKDYVAEHPGQNPPQDGFSPVATVTQTAEGATISITDANGTTTATVTNGKDGKDGIDGYTPVKGVDYFDGQPGKDGVDGSPGADGYTPVKGEDYFDGEDGKDGNGIKSAVLNADYTLTLTFDDGTTYTTPSIRGATGSTGSAGKNGVDGQDGSDGVGISSINQTTTSTADGGNNVFTVTLTNGTSATFTVKNGSKGSAGDAGKDGADGHTPVRGTDYWTDEDKAEIEAYIDGKLSEEDSGTQEIFVDVLADVGYQEMYRINSSGAFRAWDGDTPADLTGYIPVAPGDVIRMENITIPSVFVSGTYYQQAASYTSEKAFIKKVNLVVDDAGIWQSMDMQIEDGNVTGFTVAPAVFGENVAFIAINAYDINANSKIYVNSTIISGGGGDVPDYWLAEMATKADAIQQAVETAGRNGAGFLWYTDVHWEDNAKVSPMLLRYLRKHTPLRSVKFGGDVVCDPTSFTHANIRYVYDWMAATADLEQDAVPGNHDYNHHSTDVSAMTYAFILAPHKKAPMVVGDGLYYYIDEPCERTRYLHLDYLTSDHAAMTAQGEFIVDALKSTPEGWHIIAIAHRWFQYTSSAAPTVGSVPNYEKEILTIFDEYNARGSHTASNYFDTQSFADGKGKVEFCVGGHIHVDYDFTSDGGIPVIITASDTNQDRSPDETEDSGTVGTTTESAVYGIIADYGNNKITVVGVGRGGSRVIALG